MTRQNIDALRSLMKEHGIDAYIIPSTDPHKSEYLPQLWKRREFISGFTGSAGDVVVTLETAGLWTDSRYFLQAEAQLDFDVFTLFRFGTPDVPSYEDWLAGNMKPGREVGVDPRLLACESFEKLQGKLMKAKVELRPIGENLVDKVWTDRPSFPDAPVKVQDLAYAGETVAEKLGRLREGMAVMGADAHVVTMLDAVAWLFNIRGTDVDYNPVVIGYAVVTEKAAYLFVDEKKITNEVRAHLGNGVSIRAYDEFEGTLEELREAGMRTWIDPKTCSQWVKDRLGPDCIKDESPVTLFKATKNPTEIEGCRKAHVRDGAAMVRFFIWLERALEAGGVTELVIGGKLEEFRAMGERYQGPSFPPIVGYGEHGAVIHYSASKETDVEVKAPGILLIDSGGQYLDGTTDITRTITLGEPTEEQRDRFTRVLKCHINLARQAFPDGCDGKQLDVLARSFLWDAGLNFGHGIGHGVGAYLNVHEAPPGISFRTGHGQPTRANMLVTNEPGYYKEGEYGIRIENVMLIQEVEGLAEGDVPFLKMEPLTMCPTDLGLVKKDLMSDEEIAYLNEYHEQVRWELNPLLDEEERAWLARAARAI